MPEQAFGRVPLESVTTAIKDGTHGTHARSGYGVPFLSAKNITDSGMVSWDETDDCIAEAEYEQIHRTFRLQPKDLLLTIVGSLGRRAVYDGSRVTFQRSVAYVRPDRQRVSERFLFHWFAHSQFQHELLRRSNSTAQAGLYLGELARTLVPDCRLAEQAEIAEILDTLDTTLRQTEAIIDKLKQVKQGLLLDLLTRGIDANGELRPRQSEAPHLYKDSPLGWIPLGWAVRKLGDLSASMTNGFVGTALPHYSQDDDAVPYLYGNNVRPNTVDISSCARVSKRFHRQQVKSQLAPGDLLTVQSGHIGTTAAVPQWLGNANCHALIITRLATSEILPEYVARYCNSALGQSDMRGIFVGSTIPHINVKDFKSFMIPLPTHAVEQQAICAAVERADRRVETEGKELAKLRFAKSGLRDDLLTGRVRVTSLPA
jgi:type I restriction enzyme S subunit